MGRMGKGIPQVDKYKKKKKKGKKNVRGNQVDAFGESIPSSDGTTASSSGKGKALPNNGRRKRSKKSEKKSAAGFLIAAAACVASLTWAVVTNVTQNKRSKQILQSMRKKPLVFTEHASCRMECRFISKKDVLTSLFRGRVNMRKSVPNEKPCPKYVVDADIKTPQGREKRIQNVFSACPTETRLVTAIDTSTNWPCGPC
mmetsp:Transcript_2894/g.5884  ORF Transcript_2894/g.5884 Transcript_2894/m.5884 type:complete len:200 (-) Transcript_2894:1721-2320(-)